LVAPLLVWLLVAAGTPSLALRCMSHQLMTWEHVVLLYVLGRLLWSYGVASPLLLN
jgi:hypothetical protein